MPAIKSNGLRTPELAKIAVREVASRPTSAMAANRIETALHSTNDDSLTGRVMMCSHIAERAARPPGWSSVMHNWEKPMFCGGLDSSRALAERSHG